MIEERLAACRRALPEALVPEPKTYDIWPGRFRGRVALVSGAAAGIGMVTARRLGREGATIVALDRDEDNLSAVVEELSASGIDCVQVIADVTDTGALDDHVAGVLAATGRIDCLVSCAGISGRAEWDQVAGKTWDEVLDTNLRGNFFLMQAVARGMVEQRYGRIVNIASGAGKAPRPSSLHYAASKAGIISVTRSLALTLAPFGVNVNAICPENVITEMTVRSVLGGRHAQPIGPPGINRPMHPDEPAALIAFLLSSEAEFITGQAINIDGGRNMSA